MPAPALLSALCHAIFTGLAPRLRSAAGAGVARVPVVGVRSINSDGETDPSTIETYELAEAPPISARPLEVGDVLLTIRGSAPKTSLIEERFSAPTYASGNLAVLRADRAQLDPAYLWSFLMAVCARERHPLLTRATTGQLSIRMADLSNLPIRLVAMDQQCEIGRAALALRQAVTAERRALIFGERTLRAFFSEWFPST